MGQHARISTAENRKTSILGVGQHPRTVGQHKTEWWVKMWQNLQDDFGLQPLTQEIRLTLLQLLEDRYGKKSIIITSQLPVAKWYEYINDPTLADAIMDRMTANANRIELKGESLRRKKSKTGQ